MKKRLFSIVLSLCMVLALMPQMVFADESGSVAGDVNLDGLVTVNDAILLQKYLEKTESLEGLQLILADFDGDGSVTYNDLTKLQDSLELPVSIITITKGKATACGTEIGTAAFSTRVTLIADSPSDNMVFDKWVVNEGSVTLADAGEETTTFIMPDEPVSVTATYKLLSADEIATLEVPFTTIVKQEGNVAPCETTFDLAVVYAKAGEESYKDVTVTGSVTTNGAGDYNGKMTFTGPSQQLRALICEGAFVQQVNSGEPNWLYDETVWCLLPSVVAMASTDDEASLNSVAIYPTVFEEDDDGTRYYSPDPDADPVNRMSFINKYTESVAEPSDPDGTTNGDADKDKDSNADAEDSAKTGDDTNLALWLALMLLAGAGITGTAVYTIRKRTNE